MSGTTVYADEVAPPTVVRQPRHWPRRVAWVLVMALVGGLFGLAVAARLQPRYTAEVSLLVAPMIGNAYATTGGNHLTDLETESHLPSSDAVLRRVAADGQSAPSAQVLRDGMSVHVVPNAQVVVIEYAGASPAAARAMALRIAQATLDERTAIAQAAGASQVEVATAKLAALGREQSKAAAAQVEAHAKDETIPEKLPEARLALWSQRAVALNSEIRQATTSGAASPGQVIDTVMRGDGHLGKIRLAVVVGFAFLGALIGLWVGRAPRRDRG